MKKIIKQLTAALLLSFLLTNCKIDNKQHKSVLGNNIVVSQERTISKDIQGIEVQEGITVYLTNGNDQSLTIETDENLVDLIKTEFKGGTLKIFCEPNIKKSKARNVYLTTDNISKIETSSTAKVIAENTIFCKSMHLESSSSSSIELRVNTDDLYVNSSSGSKITISGKSSNYTVDSSSGSFINTYTLKAQNTKAKASSGSHIKLYTTESLKAKASSGGIIKYEGNPKKIEKKETSGGKISAG